jgi:hypothetical protein
LYFVNEKEVEDYACVNIIKGVSMLLSFLHNRKVYGSDETFVQMFGQHFREKGEGDETKLTDAHISIKIATFFIRLSKADSAEAKSNLLACIFEIFKFIEPFQFYGTDKKSFQMDKGLTLLRVNLFKYLNDPQILQNHHSVALCVKNIFYLAISRGSVEDILQLVQFLFNNPQIQVNLVGIL